MGITASSANFLLHSRQYGVKFSSTLMLGRQQIFIDDMEKEAMNRRLSGIGSVLPASGGFSESFFKFLGADKIDSMDFSNFEGATVIHDLNNPVQPALVNKYSIVFDGGTLEHVFNYPTAIKTCMDMVQIGGHFVTITPSNNFCGHGFYQLSPELFFSLFTDQHGFKVDLVALLVEPEDGPPQWYQVKNPAQLKRRVTLVNSYPTTIAVVARKTRDTSNVVLRPMQSDYAHIWSVHNSIQRNVQIQGEGKLIHYYRRLVPEWIKRKIRGVTNRKADKMEQTEFLGKVNPDFFTPLDILM